MESTEVRIYREEREAQRGVPLYWESWCLTTGEYTVDEAHLGDFAPMDVPVDTADPLETPFARYRRHYDRIDWTQ